VIAIWIVITLLAILGTLDCMGEFAMSASLAILTVTLIALIFGR
jgi:hypothetical protein